VARLAEARAGTYENEGGKGGVIVGSMINSGGVRPENKKSTGGMRLYSQVRLGGKDFCGAHPLNLGRTRLRIFSGKAPLLGPVLSERGDGPKEGERSVQIWKNQGKVFQLKKRDSSQALSIQGGKGEGER